MSTPFFTICIFKYLSRLPANQKYSKMKQEHDKLFRTVKSFSNNVLEADVYYFSFNLIMNKTQKK